MFPATSTNSNNATHTEGKISMSIILLISGLIALIIIPPFILAGVALFKNQRRTKDKFIPQPRSNMTISIPIMTLELGNQDHPLRSKPITPPDLFKPLPPLPPLPYPTLKPFTIPTPTYCNDLPRSSFPFQPQVQLQPRQHLQPTLRSKQTWRTSNPPSPPKEHNTRHNPVSMISLISRCSSTYADVDLGDPISPLALSATLVPRIASKSWEVTPSDSRALSGKARNLDTVFEAIDDSRSECREGEGEDLYCTFGGSFTSSSRSKANGSVDAHAKVEDLEERRRRVGVWVEGVLREC